MFIFYIVILLDLFFIFLLFFLFFPLMNVFMTPSIFQLQLPLLSCVDVYPLCDDIESINFLT